MSSDERHDPDGAAGRGRVGVLARFEFTADGQGEAEEFFRRGRAVVEDQPAGTRWFAFRVGPTTYGAFAVFETETDRERLLGAGGPRAARESAHLFAAPPAFEKVDIVAAREPDRSPGQGDHQPAQGDRDV